jgi:hypothetical protein
MLQPNTRVKRLNDAGVPEGPFGTVVKILPDHVFVKWDDGGASIMNGSGLVPVHRLRSWFKHGLPKLRKRA